jgi:hypothetical protein
MPRLQPSYMQRHCRISYSASIDIRTTRNSRNTRDIRDIRDPSA